MSKGLNKNKAEVTKAIIRLANQECLTVPEAQEMYSKMSRKKQRKLLASK